MASLTNPSPSAGRSPRARTTGYYYVPLPLPLLARLRDVPLAVGVYAIIARVFRATRVAVPLSPADLQAYDPSISESQAIRALRRLVSAGYLLQAPSEGRRNAYLPTWGRIGGVVRAWDLAAASLGRPRHIGAQPLPQDLLDHYLGRLEPHALRGAHVTRYVTQPLLGLIDVGTYALASAGYPGHRPALDRLGLMTDSRCCALPGLEALLALVSQRRLFDAESPIALTPAGWARLGLTPPEAPTGTPLIFIPALPDAVRHGYPIGQPIGCAAEVERPPSASGRPRGRFAPPPQGSHGFPCEEGSKNHPHPPPGAGGGVASHSASRAIESDTPAASPAAARLREIGVRRDVAATLAGRSLAQVERVIGLARRHPGVRDIAAWVVSVLRALPAEEPAAQPPPKVSDLAILTHQGLTNAERTRWLTRFRHADPIDRPDILNRFLQEHPICT